MIRSAGIRKRKRLSTQVAERRQPLAEQRSDSIIPLQIDAANLACAVIEIEIAGQLVVLRHLN